MATKGLDFSRQALSTAGSRNPQRGAATPPVVFPLLSPLSIENPFGLRKTIALKHICMFRNARFEFAVAFQNEPLQPEKA